MTRWWADPVASRGVLALVDDSNVEQGVGTAVLGYHGLAVGVLEPLTRKTLMDVSAVRKALSGVDIIPVAKALGEATKPIVGDASERYGQLLAEDLHRQAIEATERLLLSLTTSGMPWPVAVDRAASVHGVPMQRLGQAGARLRAPFMPPMVRDDAADRALMEYAAHVGHRENTVTDVSKAFGGQEGEFDPKEHPRGARGRFVRAPDRISPADEERKARAERRQRRAKRIQVNQRRIQDQQRANARRESAATQEQKLSLFDMARGLVAREEKQKQVNAGLMSRNMAQKLQDKINERLGRQPQQQEQDQENVILDDYDETISIMEPIDAQRGEYKINGERFALVPVHMAEQIKSKKDFSLGRFEDLVGHRIEFMHAETLTAELSKYTPEILRDYAILRIDGEMPTQGGAPGDELITLARSAMLGQTDATLMPAANGFTYMHGFMRDVPAEEAGAGVLNPAFATGKVPLPMVDLRLNNAKDYDHLFDDSPPLPYDRGVGKADRFDENDVRRDYRGRFDHEPGAYPSPSLEREQRIARRKRRNARQRQIQRTRVRLEQQQAAQAAQFVTSRASLMDMARTSQEQRKQAEKTKAAGMDMAAQALQRNINARLGASDPLRRKLERNAQRGENSVAESYNAFLTDNQLAALQALGESRWDTPASEMAAIQRELESITFGFGRQALQEGIEQANGELDFEHAVQAGMNEGELFSADDTAAALDSMNRFRERAAGKYDSGMIGALSEAEHMALDPDTIFTVMEVDLEVGELPAWLGKTKLKPMGPAAAPPRGKVIIPVMVDASRQPDLPGRNLLSVDHATMKRIQNGDWPEIVLNENVGEMAQVARDSNLQGVPVRNGGLRHFRANFGQNGDRL